MSPSSSTSRRPSLPRLDTTTGKEKRPLPILPAVAGPSSRVLPDRRTPRPLPAIPRGRAQIEFDAGSSTWVIKAPLTQPTPRRRERGQLKSHHVASANALGAMMAKGKGKEREKDKVVSAPPLPRNPLPPTPTTTRTRLSSAGALTMPRPPRPASRSVSTFRSEPSSPTSAPTSARKLPIPKTAVDSPQSTILTTSTYGFTRDSGLTNLTSPLNSGGGEREHEHPTTELWLLDAEEKEPSILTLAGRPPPKHPFENSGTVVSSPGDDEPIPLGSLIPTFTRGTTEFDSAGYRSSEESSEESADDEVEYAYYPYRKMRWDPEPTTTTTVPVPPLPPPPPQRVPPPLQLSSAAAEVDVYIDDSYSPGGLTSSVGGMAFKPPLPSAGSSRRSLSPIRYAARRSSQIDMEALTLEDLDLDHPPDFAGLVLPGGSGGEVELEEMSFAPNENLVGSPDGGDSSNGGKSGVGSPLGVMGQREQGDILTLTSPARSPLSPIPRLTRSTSVDSTTLALSFTSTTTPRDTPSISLKPNRFGEQPYSPYSSYSQHPQIGLLPSNLGRDSPEWDRIIPLPLPSSSSTSPRHSHVSAYYEPRRGTVVGRVEKSAQGIGGMISPIGSPTLGSTVPKGLLGGGLSPGKGQQHRQGQRGGSLPPKPKKKKEGYDTWGSSSGEGAR